MQETLKTLIGILPILCQRNREPLQIHPSPIILHPCHSMKFCLRFLLLPFVAGSLSSCNTIMGLPSRVIGSVLSTVKLADNKKKDAALENVAAADAKDAKSVPEGAVGEVSYVDTESGFILIRQAAGRRIVPSTPLLSKNPTGTITAKLLSSPANKGSFVAADIVSGAPERGNPVHFDPDAKTKVESQPVLTPAADPATPDAGALPNRPKLEPLLPPLDDLRPPSGSETPPQLPALPQ
jgi:hypothetical protein